VIFIKNVGNEKFSGIQASDKIELERFIRQVVKLIFLFKTSNFFSVI